jgi:membrane-associated phospholipid phosphatase
MSRTLARALSIAGHPLLVLPAAVMGPLATRGQGLRGALPFALGFAAAGALVLSAMPTARWCQLSLHVAFAADTACLLGPLGAGAVLAGLAFAAAVAWSRLALSRHAPRDRIAGAAAGVAAGLAYWHTL